MIEKIECIDYFLDCDDYDNDDDDNDCDDDDDMYNIDDVDDNVDDDDDNDEYKTVSILKSSPWCFPSKLTNSSAFIALQLCLFHCGDDNDYDHDYGETDGDND